jgi:hypothetical protein
MQLIASEIYATGGKTRYTTGLVERLAKAIEDLPTGSKTFTYNVDTNYAQSGYVPHYGHYAGAAGGWVHGAGTSTSDSIAALLSNGEFVVKADAARHYGPILEAINAKKFAAGGPVTVPGAGPGVGGCNHTTVVHNHMYLDGKEISDALRTDVLTYARRNTSSNLTLRTR